MHPTTKALLDAVRREHPFALDGTDAASREAEFRWRQAGCPDACPRYTVAVVQDPDPESPEAWAADIDLFLVAGHRSFDVRAPALVAKLDAAAYGGRGSHKAFRVYAYIHSGVHLFLRAGDATRAAGSHAGWDTCAVGHVFVQREAYGDDDAAMLKAADGLVSSWNAYLSGDIWGYTVTDEAGDVVESCWGYVGDRDYCLQDGVAAAQALCTEDNGATYTVAPATED